MTQDHQSCAMMSLALDESTYINDIPCLAVTVHYFIYGEVQEDMGFFSAMHSTTKGTNILNAVKAFLHNNRSTCTVRFLLLLMVHLLWQVKQLDL